MKINLILPKSFAGLRLDQALAKALPAYSRTEVRSWLDQKLLFVDEEIRLRPSTKIHGGEAIHAVIPPRVQADYIAQDIPLNIVYEDIALLIVNKPAGLIVHPGAGNPQHTLVNALLHYAPALEALPRAGLIHRLDRDTSGLIIIAKNIIAFKQLTEKMQNRTISRIYTAIVKGIPISGGKIETFIGRHPLKRTRMAVREENEGGKLAVTHYHILQKYRYHTLLQIQLETGRTHQIRVHMAYKHFPLLGDPVYGGRLQIPKSATVELTNVLRQFKRQALHASTLTLSHPISGKLLKCHAPLPEDMQYLIRMLEDD